MVRRAGVNVSPSSPTMTGWVWGVIIVVVVGPPGMVVVVVTGQLPALQASQQLGTSCTQAAPSLRRLAFSGVRLDGALGDAFRRGSTARDEARSAARRLGSTPVDGVPALLRQASARHRQLRHAGNTFDVLPVTCRGRAGQLRVSHRARGSGGGGIGAGSVSHGRPE